MRLTYFSWLWILVAAILSISFGRETPMEDGDRSGSVLTSILKTLSSSNESPYCPGRCFNALAALVCTKVVDKPGMCPQGYRCCQNLSSKDEAPTQDGVTIFEEGTLEVRTASSDNEDAPSETMKLRDKTMTLELKVDEKKKDISERADHEEAIEKLDSDLSALLQYPPSTSVKVCRGVCVAERISNFCEAAIDVEGLCKAELRCCVPANLFDGVDEVPKEFVILNPATGNKTQEEQSRAEVTYSPKPFAAATPFSSTISSGRGTTKTTIKSATLSQTTTEDPTSSHREQGMSSPEWGVGTASLDKEDDNIPPEKKCKGTCVAGFFAFLCDSIDRTRECPRGGRCCVTQIRPGSKPQPQQEEDSEGENSHQRETTSKPNRRTTTTTTITATTPFTPTPSREPPPPPCLGTCLPVSVASRCQSPSRLVVASGCRDDEICCDDVGKKPTGKNPPQARPGSQVPQALGTLLSLFGGGPQKNNRPSRPVRPPRPTITTTTTTTTTTPSTTTEAAPECPGTCIAPILSFTCFGNAEMTELFRCNKEKQSCCAPKSTIREMNRRNHIDNIARNDTIFTPPFHPHGHYGQPHSPFEHPPYPQPSFVQPPYHQPPEGGNFHRPIYNPQSPLQPPPPPPPPHLRVSEHHQSSADHPLPPPPQFQPPPFENPLHEEEQPFPPYRQPAPDSPERPQQYPYSPDSIPPFYQSGSTYEQNHSVNYPPPPAITTPSSVLTTSAAFENEPQVTNKYVCGVKGTNRIARVVGGEDSVPGEWCWQVALINSLNQYLCGGALIGTQWVLTAAHCVTNIVRSGDAIYVRVGDHDLTTRYGSPGAQTIPVATTYIHHNHNSQTLDNDIALLKLSSHAELGNGVCLVCLPARGVSQVAGKRCTVTGYGYMGETGPIPLRIREAEIPVVSDNECVRQINAVTEKIFILPASSFCAGGESGHDACQGDGGGPLVCNVDNYFELSGLVSWGFGCGRKDVPGVYVKVASFIGWINQIISVNNL